MSSAATATAEGAWPTKPVSPGVSAPGTARAAGFAALAFYGVTQWSRLLAPTPRWSLLLGLVLASVLGLAVARAAGGGRVVRLGARAALLVAALAAVLLLADVRPALLDPREWGRLASGIVHGIGGIPTAEVPYRGEEPWTRVAILGAGQLLLLAGGWLGLRARGGDATRVLAAVPLLVLAGVPAVVAHARLPYLQGALLALALAGFLWLERVPRRDAPAAATVLALATAVAWTAAPALQHARPLVDYLRVTAALRDRSGTAFDWTQRYGPLDWARDGRVVLRVHARFPAYWKTENLGDFDGVGWRRDPATEMAVSAAAAPAGAFTAGRWRQRLTVTLGALRTLDFVGSGTTVAIDRAPHQPRPIGAGTWGSAVPLVRADSYRAETYTPQPSARDLRAASPSYPSGLASYLTVGLPGPAAPLSPRRPDAQQVLMPGFGSGADVDIARTLDASPYSAAYALALRMKAHASTPYDYVHAVERRLGRGYRYSEDAPVRDLPLESFLFRDRQGDCQHFAGAMALLLRLGGVPARVATGFSTGQRAGRGEWLVRDTDAHAWVEAWFPGYGWVTFDPTPAAAPARGGTGRDGGTSAASRSGLGFTRGEVPGSSAAGLRLRAAPRGPSAALLAAPAGGAVLLAALGVLFLRRRRRGSRPADRALADLQRALRRAGRRPAARTTLAELAQRYAGSPDAAAYVDVVRGARYGGAVTPVRPTTRQRRALRAELARGLGARGRLRALWALPPGALWR